MRNFILFVHGTYRRGDLPFYRKLCRAKVKVAVNGGYRFFLKAGVKPDVLIGDMDSITRLKQLPARTIVVSFPVRKDRTDTQLAVEYCIEQGAMSIDIVQPSVGQPDHFVANFLMSRLEGMTRWARKGGKLRFVNADYEVFLLSDSEVSFSRRMGDTVSVMSLSRTATLTCRGTDFDVSGARISKGHTRGLRNRIASGKASFAVNGEALVWHLFHR